MNENFINPNSDNSKKTSFELKCSREISREKIIQYFESSKCYNYISNLQI